MVRQTSLDASYTIPGVGPTASSRRARTRRMRARTAGVWLVISTLGWLLTPTGTLAQSAPAATTQPPVPGLEVPPPGVQQELVLRDGTRAVGRIERIDGDRLTFRTTAGAVLETDVAHVLTVRPVKRAGTGGSRYADDPNPSRLFFGPTGRSVKRGEGYIGVYEVVFPFVQVGVTDHISVGGGTPLFFGSGSSHPFWFTPKIQVLDLPTTQASIGTMHFMNIDDAESLGIAYGAVTKGTPDTAVTVGVGYAYSQTSGMTGSAVWMIGGEHRISRRAKLITENYVFDGGGIASFGVRFLGEHLAADLGLATPLGVGGTFVFPMVNFVWQF